MQIHADCSWISSLLFIIQWHAEFTFPQLVEMLILHFMGKGKGTKRWMWKYSSQHEFLLLGRRNPQISTEREASLCSCSTYNTVNSKGKWKKDIKSIKNKRKHQQQQQKSPKTSALRVTALCWFTVFVFMCCYGPYFHYPTIFFNLRLLCITSCSAIHGWCS